MRHSSDRKIDTSSKSFMYKTRTSNTLQSHRQSGHSARTCPRPHRQSSRQCAIHQIGRSILPPKVLCTKHGLRTLSNPIAKADIALALVPGLIVNPADNAPFIRSEDRYFLQKFYVQNTDFEHSPIPSPKRT